jgi:hypothetical protein
MRSVTSRGSPYARFRRALANGNLATVRAAAAELPQVDLDDALEVCALMAGTEPQRYDRAALRWLARFCLERSGVTLTDVAEAADALDLLRSEPAAGRAELRRLLAQ